MSCQKPQLTAHFSKRGRMDTDFSGFEHTIALRAGLESRGVPVGLAQAPRMGQFLPEQAERGAHHRPQQAQERSEVTLDHCRLRYASYAAVMS